MSGRPRGRRRSPSPDCTHSAISGPGDVSTASPHPRNILHGTRDQRREYFARVKVLLGDLSGGPAMAVVGAVDFADPGHSLPPRVGGEYAPSPPQPLGEAGVLKQHPAATWQGS